MTKKTVHVNAKQTSADTTVEDISQVPRTTVTPQTAVNLDEFSTEEPSALGPVALADRIGTEIIGPLCYGFSLWLIEQAREAGITQLYFLSRDGWLLKQAFDHLPDYVTEGLTSHYLYSSRRALWFASLKEDTAEAEFNEILAGASPYVPVAGFLTRVFIDPQRCLSQIREAGFENENAIVDTASDKQKLYGLFQAIKPQIVANAAQERADYLAYLKHSGVFANKKAALIDVGWTGSVIKYTRRLVKDVNDSIDLHGFYIGVGRQAKTKYKFTKGDCLRGYLFDFDDQAFMDIRRGFFIIEKFLSPKEPSLIRMKRDEAGFKPVYKQGDLESSPLSPTVQKSALQFVQEYSRSAEADKPFKVDYFLPQLRKLLSSPDPEEAKILSQYSYSSDFGYQVQPVSIAKSELGSTYARSPWLLVKHYRRARWKAGFIAQQPFPVRLALLAINKGGLDKAFERMLVRIKKLR